MHYRAEKGMIQLPEGYCTKYILQAYYTMDCRRLGATFINKTRILIHFCTFTNPMLEGKHIMCVCVCERERERERERKHTRVRIDVDRNYSPPL